MVTEIEHRVPLKRAGLPHEIAGVVAFLCIRNAAYITGQTICVEGGMTIHGFTLDLSKLGMWKLSVSKRLTIFLNSCYWVMLIWPIFSAFDCRWTPNLNPHGILNSLNSHLRASTLWTFGTPTQFPWPSQYAQLLPKNLNPPRTPNSKYIST